MNVKGAEIEARSSLSAASVLTLIGLLWLMAGPRVDVVAFAGSSVRIEDALLAAALVVVIARWRVARPLIAGRGGIGVVTWVSLVAAGVGVASGTVRLAPSILYAIRPFEYWAVFPLVLLLLARGGRAAETALLRVLAVATVAHTLVAMAQFLFGFNIGFSAFSLERGAGLTNGPYELGAIMAMLVCFWLSERRLVLTMFAGAGLLMSLSRVSIIGVLVGLAVMGLAYALRRGAPHVVRRPAPRPESVVALTVAAVAVVLALPMIASQLIVPAVDRTQSTSISDSWSAGRQLAAITPRSDNSDQYAATAYDAIGDTVLDNVTSGDASNEVRFYRWNLLLNELTRSPERLALGLGPSFAGPSVDGAYLRIAVESGLVGIGVWLFMFHGWVRRSPPWFVGAAASLFVGAVFIDLFYAERPMLFLWMLLALAVHRSTNRKDPTR